MIAKLIKDLRPEIPTRAIGRAVGLKQRTAQDAVSGKRSAKPKKLSQISGTVSGERSTPPVQISGAKAAVLVAKRGAT